MLLALAPLVPGFCACAPVETPLAGDRVCSDLRLDHPPDRPNVVLIVNDTMRSDAPGIAGGAARTPTFDAFAHEHLWFPEVVAPSVWTKPSVASIFTGLYPSQHGLIAHPQGKQKPKSALLETEVLGEELETIAEQFRGAGYRTAAFITNPWSTLR